MESIQINQKIFPDIIHVEWNDNVFKVKMIIY